MFTTGVFGMNLISPALYSFPVQWSTQTLSVYVVLGESHYFTKKNQNLASMGFMNRLIHNVHANFGESR